MQVIYNESNNNLIVVCNPYEKDLPKALPNRRYSNKIKAWLVPCNRINARLITETWFNDRRVNISDKVRKIIVGALEGPIVIKKPFPSKYRFKHVCYEHQKKALDYIYSLKKSALFVEMGLGKTKIAQDKMGVHYLEKKINALLVVCPYSIRFNWVVEFSKHCAVPYDIAVIDLKTTSDVRKIDSYINKKIDTLKILIVGVESLQSGRAIAKCSTFIDTHKAGVIVDEAHTIKTHSASRTKNLIAISKNAVYKLIMTGTPVSQGILDLYGQFLFLDPNIMGVGDFWSYKARYTITEEIRVGGNRKINKVVGYKNVEELLEIIKPFVFQCTKDEALDLPDKVKIKRYVTLTKEQQKLYNEIKNERVAILPNISDVKIPDTMLVVQYILTMYTTLQQVLGGFVTRGTGEYTSTGNEIRETLPVVIRDKNPKILELKNIIAELVDSEQVIIWAKYRAEVFMIAQQLEYYMTDKFEKGCEIFIDKTDEERKQIINNMNNKKTRYFISTHKSGGTGITLNTVSYVVYYSNSFSQLERSQTEDRNHRIGQKRKVTYIDLVVKDTVDTTILKALKDKKDLADYVKECLSDGKDYVE